METKFKIFGAACVLLLATAGVTDAQEIPAADIKPEPNSTEILSEMPKDYHWDRTVIISGKFVFLALPFEKQAKNGICVAASALNVVKYIDPTLQLDQTELFKMFNAGVAGANGPQMIGALENLGFHVQTVNPKELSVKDLTSAIQSSLEDNRPIIAFKPGHAITIIGFNKETKKVIAWNQREESDAHNGMPKGAYEMAEASVPGNFREIYFVSKRETKVSPVERRAIESIVGKTDDLQRHVISNANSERESPQSYASHAIPPMLKQLMRSGRTILIRKGNDVMSINPQESETVTVTTFPDAKARQVTLRNLAGEIAVNGNPMFYSAKTVESKTIGQ